MRALSLSVIGVFVNELLSGLWKPVEFDEICSERTACSTIFLRYNWTIMLPQVRLDRTADTPLHQQLGDELRRQVLSGELRTQQRSSRKLHIASITSRRTGG